MKSVGVVGCRAGWLVVSIHDNGVFPRATMHSSLHVPGEKGYALEESQKHEE